MLEWLKSKVRSRKISTLPLPSAPEKFGDYKENFERARKFTIDRGFVAKEIVWTNTEISTENINGALDLAGIKDLRHSAVQCLKWCHYMAPYFENHLGCQVELTIGQLWAGDKVVYNPTWKDIDRWVSQGMQAEDFQDRVGINLHAWLTAENGEIIEPTLLSSLATVNEGFRKYAGGIAYGPETEILGHRYFPLATGMQIAESISQKSMMKLLANTPADLYQMDYGVIIWEL
jgi:hypothetical protein